MVGREDGDHRVRVVPGDHGRTETDRIDRVAAGRLAEELLRGQPGNGVEDHLGMLLAGADKAALGGNEPFQPLVGDLQKALAGNEGDELLRQGSAAHRPQSRARAAGNDQCVSHGMFSERQWRRRLTQLPVLRLRRCKRRPCRQAGRSRPRCSDRPAGRPLSAPRWPWPDRTSRANRDSLAASRRRERPARPTGSAWPAECRRPKRLRPSRRPRPAIGSTAGRPVCRRDRACL